MNNIHIDVRLAHLWYNDKRAEHNRAKPKAMQLLIAASQWYHWQIVHQTLQQSII